MSAEAQHEHDHLAELTVEIVSAYVSNNAISPSDLVTLISSTHAALVNAQKPDLTPEPEPVLKPLVPIKKSVTPDYIISLEDGRQYKTLKRHLAGVGLTPEQYRTKWNLPSDYPMVAANYASMRSELAKSLGLGRKRAEEVVAQATPEPTKPKRKKIGLKL